MMTLVIGLDYHYRYDSNVMIFYRVFRCFTVDPLQFCKIKVALIFGFHFYNCENILTYLPAYVVKQDRFFRNY